jgi:hypothetical protein
LLAVLITPPNAEPATTNAQTTAAATPANFGLILYLHLGREDRRQAHATPPP